MHVIARPALRDFSEKHARSKAALDAWWFMMTHNEYANFGQLHQHFSGVDTVGDSRFVFNICGNRYRLLARIFFAGRMVYIRRIMTHEEYDEWNATGRPD